MKKVKNNSSKHCCKKTLNIPMYILSTIILVVITISLLMCQKYVWIHSPIQNRGIASIRGDSMSPTIKNNDIVYTQEAQTTRGSIVVLKYKNERNEEKIYLKRIIGIPGDVVEITKEGVLVNNKLLKEDYTKNANKTLLEENEYNEILLSSDEYFVMGDNREASYDSRHFGPIHKSNFLYGLTTTPNEHTKAIKATHLTIAFCIVVIPSAIWAILTFKILSLKLQRKNKKKEKENDKEGKLESKKEKEKK